MSRDMSRDYPKVQPVVIMNLYNNHGRTMIISVYNNPELLDNPVRVTA